MSGGGFLAQRLLEAKFKKLQFGEKVDQHFAEHRLDFDQATVSRIVIADEDLARELALQLKEESAPFTDFARRFSEEATTRSQGGYAGRVTRKDLGALVAPAVFGSAPGMVAGPIKVGKAYHILRVEELHPAKMDDATRAKILDLLYKEWLVEARAKANIQLPLFSAGLALVEVTR